MATSPTTTTASSNGSMDDWNVDIVLQVLPYLSLWDANHFQLTSRRYWYLVQEYRRLLLPTSNMVTMATEELQSTAHLYGSIAQGLMQHAAQHKLQTVPNLLVGSCTTRSTLPQALPAWCPSHSVIVGTVSDSVQVTSPTVESDSNAGLMLATLPPNSIYPFCLAAATTTRARSNRHDTPGFPRSARELVQQIRQHAETQFQGQPPQAILVYGTGPDATQIETILETLQQAFSQETTIVGGLCQGGYVSEPTSQISRAELEGLSSSELMVWYRGLGGRSSAASSNHWTRKELMDRVGQMLHERPYRLRLITDDNGGVAMFGVALFGTVPTIHTLVSRGVQSLTRPTPTPTPSLSLSPTLASHNFVIDQAAFYRPHNDEYIFQSRRVGGGGTTAGRDSLPSYHIVRRIRDMDTGKVYTPTELQARFGNPDFIGLQRPGQNGFTLHQPHFMSYNLNAYIFLHTKGDNQTEDENNNNQEDPSTASLEGSLIDLFDMTGQACVEDLERTLFTWKQNEDQSQSKILGALLVSCTARGPHASSLMLGQAMADANCFAKAFPQVPCLGWYANGEIGPPAVVAATTTPNHKAVQGACCLQGFTAIFLLFVAASPPPHSIAASASTNNTAGIQDDPESIQRAIQTQLLAARRGDTKNK